ncbi:MAG: hypothetical protein AAF531_26080 [Actinomycetota bacterium]
MGVVGRKESVVKWVRREAKIGDLLLIGSQDRVSRVIQRASNSRFSHAAVITDDDEVTEAYDYSLTLNEDDEGIYRTTIADFLTRTPKMHVVRLLRPNAIDVDKLQRAARELFRRAPPYPTIGATFLGFIRLLSEPIPHPEEGLFGQQRFGRRLHRWLDAVATAQVGFVGDGIHKVHCAESVVQIYRTAGFDVILPQPFLIRSVDRADRLRADALHRELNRPEETVTGTSDVTPSTTPAAQRDIDRGNRTTSGRQVILAVLRRPHRLAGSVYRVWKVRMETRHLACPNDYIFPGDLERADGFTLVDERHVARGRRRFGRQKGARSA